jgi:nicotinamidase/pyrazinamidase
MDTFKADRIVSINVDVQNDFMPGGRLAVPYGNQVIDVLNSINAFTRQQNGLVVATGDQHPLETPHFGPDAWPVHCVKGTHGAALDERLNIQPTDIIIDKGMGQTDGYSAFEGVTRDGQSLESIIQPARHERVAALFGGVATEYCVLNTVLDATKLNYNPDSLRLYVVEDAVRGIDDISATEAMERMQRAGAIIIKSSDLLSGRALTTA